MDNSPLSQAQIRGLTDKMYEKRKAAAQEIEKMLKDLIQSQQTGHIVRILDALAELCRAPNVHTRKGGLIGMAAAAIALGNKLALNYTDKLIIPVLECFNDNDSNVRYFACESLYNIIKVTRDGALVHFAPLFDTLCKLSADVDQNVKSGSQLLDKLLKDIVSNSKTFDIAQLMLLLRERIHTNNSFVRRFLVSWLSSLSTVPNLDLLPFLPEILDGLLQTLGDQTQYVRDQCEAVLGQFLKTLKTRPTELEMKHIVNVLIVHAQSEDELVRFIALVWLRDLLVMNEQKLLPYASGYLLAVLPCLAHTDSKQHRDVHQVARAINVQLMELISKEKISSSEPLDLSGVVDVLLTHSTHQSVQTRVASLRWIHHLHKNMPEQIFKCMNRLFPVLLALVSDASDEVVLLNVEVLSAICDTSSSADGDSVTMMKALNVSKESMEQLKGQSPLFVSFMCSLLSLFRENTALLQERGAFIIRQLCMLMSAERVYVTLAVLVCDESDVWFIAVLVRTLNTILLTSTELFTLRCALSPIANEESARLFTCLYKCWCYHPIAVISLCLLARAYDHAALLVHNMSSFDITVDVLVEIDKLIQLIDSPIFAYIRMDLLSPHHRTQLSSVLYALLMIMPQTEAFHTLHRRLQCLPPTDIHALGSPVKAKKNPSDGLINWTVLLEHYRTVQTEHNNKRRLKHKEDINRAVNSSLNAL